MGEAHAGRVPPKPREGASLQGRMSTSSRCTQVLDHDGTANGLSRSCAMNIDYYVVPQGGGYQVKREGVSRGWHDNLARAAQSACFMASIESKQLHAEVEVYIQGRHGELMRSAHYRGGKVPPSLARPGVAKGMNWERSAGDETTIPPAPAASVR
jgi:hypothetical protein